MKQIQKSKLLKLNLLVCFLLLQFFVSAFTYTTPTLAASDCTFTVNSFTPSKTSALPTDTITFSARVTTSTTKLNGCSGQSVKLSLDFKNLYFIKETYVTSKSFRLTTDLNTLTADLTIKLGDYDLKGVYPNPNQMIFKLVVQADQTSSDSPVPIVANSQETIIYISAPLQGSGSVQPTISFNPKKDAYQVGDTLQIYVTAQANQVNNLNSGITNIFIQPVVNGKNLDGFTVNRSALANATQWKDTQITTANGFEPGKQNIITVSLWQAGQNIKLGQGSATLQVAGSTAMGVQTNATTLKPDSDLIFSITNSAGKNLRGTIEVNGTSNSFGSLPFTLKTSTANGFVNGRNTVTVKALDNATGQAVTLENSGQLTIAVDPNATTPGSNSQKYACKAGDGKYACSASNDPGLGDVYAQGGGCNAMEVQQVELCWCGKTDDQIKTQCTTTSNPPLPTDKLINPIPTEGLLDTFLGITKGFLAGLAIWAVIAIIFAGFRMVISAGNEEAITQAKKAITWAILGLVVALLSFSMVAIVQNILNVDTTKFDPQLPGSTTPPPSGTYIIQKQQNV